MIVHPLRPENERESFSCGVASLDEFLGRYALQDPHRHRVGVTYVAQEAGVVLGYMALAAGALGAEGASEQVRSGLPRYPLPILRLARLAVDERFQDQGIGSELLAAAFIVALDMSERVGCIGVVVDAKPGAAGFCERFGFEPVEAASGTAGSHAGVTLFLAIGTIVAACG